MNMASDRQKDLCRRAFDVWGTETQMVIAMEECGELIAAISHCIRERPGSIGEMAEEIADVELCCTSLRLLVDDHDAGMVDAFKQKKWDRLEARLKADDNGA